MQLSAYEFISVCFLVLIGQMVVLIYVSLQCLIFRHPFFIILTCHSVYSLIIFASKAKSY